MGSKAKSSSGRMRGAGKVSGEFASDFALLSLILALTDPDGVVAASRCWILGLLYPTCAAWLVEENWSVLCAQLDLLETTFLGMFCVMAFFL